MDVTVKMLLVLVFGALCMLLGVALASRDVQAQSVEYRELSGRLELKPQVLVAPGEGDRLYYWDGSNLWYSAEAGQPNTWKKVAPF